MAQAFQAWLAAFASIQAFTSPEAARVVRHWLMMRVDAPPGLRRQDGKYLPSVS